MRCSSRHSFDQADAYYTPQLHNSSLTKVNKKFPVKITQTYEMQTYRYPSKITPIVNVCGKVRLAAAGPAWQLI